MSSPDQSNNRYSWARSEARRGFAPRVFEAIPHYTPPPPPSQRHYEAHAMRERGAERDAEEEMRKAKESVRKAQEERERRERRERAAVEEEYKKRAEATEAKRREERAKDRAQLPIQFKDAVGRNFTFPYVRVKTWKGMEYLIKNAFLHVDVLGQHVMEGHYDLVGPDGEIILPDVWEYVVEPGLHVSMQMWPMPESGSAKRPPGRPPAPPPPHGQSSKPPGTLIPPPSHPGMPPPPPPIRMSPKSVSRPKIKMDPSDLFTNFHDGMPPGSLEMPQGMNIHGRTAKTMGAKAAVRPRNKATPSDLLAWAAGSSKTVRGSNGRDIKANKASKKLSLIEQGHQKENDIKPVKGRHSSADDDEQIVEELLNNLTQSVSDEDEEEA